MTEPVYYCVGRKAKTKLEKYMVSIINDVENMIGQGYEEGIFTPQKIPAKEVIIMVSTNIIVNLTAKALRPEVGIKKRLELMNDVLDHIKEKSLQLWTLIEAAQADDKTSH